MRSGLLAGVRYGEDNGGLEPRLRARLRTQVARGKKWGINGCLTDLCWAASGGKGDPEVESLAAPVHRYWREWWLASDDTGRRPWDCLTPKELRRMFEDAAEEYEEGARWERKAASQGLLVIEGLVKAGWSVESATVCRDLDGRRFNATVDSPKEGWSRILREMGRKLGYGHVLGGGTFGGGGLWRGSGGGFSKRG